MVSWVVEYAKANGYKSTRLIEILELIQASGHVTASELWDMICERYNSMRGRAWAKKRILEICDVVVDPHDKRRKLISLRY